MRDALLIALGFLVLCLSIVSGDKAPEDQTEHELHCEMVQIWNDTNGEYGWPDYNNTATDCQKEP